MKKNITVFAVAWLVAISALHLHLNVGWAEASSRVKVLLGMERESLYVGFLPVT